MEILKFLSTQFSVVHWRGGGGGDVDIFWNSEIEENEIVVSFDVEALYANVPIENALAIIKELLENEEILSDRTPLSPKKVLDLLEFLLRTTFFIFNGTSYQQEEGVMMGGCAERTKEHTRAVGAANTRRYETADHCWKYNHDFDWENKKIMDHKASTTTRKIK